MTTVAFQGELGAYSEEAVFRFFGEDAAPVPRRDFQEVGDAVACGDVEWGLLPIENTIAGSVVGSYDVLATANVRVVGEVVIPIHHCLLGMPGATLDGLRRIESHPVALAQCARFLQALSGVEALAVYDTAGAAREIARQGDLTRAAIASRRAAGRYGLSVLAAGVEDRPDNQTRFLVITRAEEGGGRPSNSGARAERSGEPMKMALLVETGNTPGALVGVLRPFAERGINLSKLESRPTGEPWTYRFFIEIETGAKAEADEALVEVRERATRCKFLGSYSRWSRS